MGGSSSKAAELAVFSELQSLRLHFDMHELRVLWTKFERHAEGGRLSHERFRQILAGSTFDVNSPFLERMVQVFDADRNGFIDFKEFVTGMSLFCRGTLDELVDFALQCYDLNGDGGISREEMVQGLTGLATTLSHSMRGNLLSQLRHDSTLATPVPAPTGGQTSAASSGLSLGTQSAGSSSSAPPSATSSSESMRSGGAGSAPALDDQLQAITAGEIQAFVDEAFAQFDSDRDGLLSAAEFRRAVASHPVLVAYCKARPMAAPQPQPHAAVRHA